jgi:hypothetical protein
VFLLSHAKLTNVKKFVVLEGLHGLLEPGVVDLTRVVVRVADGHCLNGTLVATLYTCTHKSSEAEKGGAIILSCS